MTGEVPQLIRQTRSSPKEAGFEINPSHPRFVDIVAGHAVLARPLCPAGMYFECAILASKLNVGGEIQGHGMRFDDCSFESPLGLSADRGSVLMNLHQGPGRHRWAFKMSSLLKHQSSKPSALHAKGHIGFIEDLRMHDYQRLVSKRVGELQRNGDLESLRKDKVYRLFSRIVNYSEIFKGISSISFAGTEAVAEVNLSHQPSESSKAERPLCDAISLDVFLQVCGLLINSPADCPSDAAYLAVGTDSLCIALSKQSRQSAKYTVYATFESVSVSQAKGDVFVLHESQLVVAMTGVRFAKVPLTKLANLLDTISVSRCRANERVFLEGVVTESCGGKTSAMFEIAISLGFDPRPFVTVLVFNPNQSQSARKVPSSKLVLDIWGRIAIELKSDIEAQFNLTMSNGLISDSTNMIDLLHYLIPEAERLSLANTDNSLSSSSPSVPSGITTPDSFGDSQKFQLDVDPVQSLAQTDTSLPSSAEKHGFTDFWSHIGHELDQLVLAYIVEALDRLGSGLMSLPPNEPVFTFKHLPKHDQLVARLWTILERFDLVGRDGEQYVRTGKSVPSLDSVQQLSQLKMKLPAYEVDLSLLALTGPELANCLTGAADPLKLLFGTPKAQQILGNFYHESPMFATMTDQLLLFVKRILEHAGSKEIRILEVGAGFGGTTATLAKLVQESECKVQYIFTDVAPTLVDKARKNFSQYAWMDFATLDLEQDPPSALLGKYDVVLATNVVHATSNLVASTRRIRSLLRDGGFMCLSEITKVIGWHNLVFGLLPGWWCFNDGRSYALQSAEEWMEVFKKAGFEAVAYSTGPSAEANSQQLLIGSTRACKQVGLPPAPLINGQQVRTEVYKTVEDIQIHADIYLPNEAPQHPMPIALMIHGGGYMTLSKSAIRPAHTRFLLSKGVLPVSLDHRLCPEINIIDGPMLDVRDAVGWARSTLPRIALGKGIKVDTDKVAVIGWSTGGHLAMTIAWTTVEAGMAPPSAILNFYGASDFEALAANRNLGQTFPGREISTARIRASLTPKPVSDSAECFVSSPNGLVIQITSYHLPSSTDENAHLGWLAHGDPRTELVLSVFKERHGLSLLLNGPSALSDLDDHSLAQKPTDSSVSKEQLDSINPFAQLQLGKYHVPTFFIHGSEDEVVPCDMSVAFERALRARGVESGICVVQGKGHVCDLAVEVGTQAWQRGMGAGYEFLLKHLGAEG
ncbi:MAG: hypothetical protein Q9207_006891 [Kuettlingeria erythrocarpa]